jgi:NitT/TauT family transport system permease protein
MRDRLERLLPSMLLLALLLLWEVLVRVFRVPPFILPAPSAILWKITEIPGRLLLHSWATLSEILEGFGAACVGGIALAAIIAHSRVLARTLYPILVTTQVVPTIAIAPVLTIWLGPSDAVRLIVIFLIGFFPMVVNTTAGLLRVDEELLDLVRGLKATRWKIFTKIRLPNALPHIFTGMRISIALCVIGAVVAEFVVSERGLGYVIFSAANNLDTLLVFTAVTLLAVMGIALYRIVVLAQRLALPWAEQEREGS